MFKLLSESALMMVFDLVSNVVSVSFVDDF